MVYVFLVCFSVYLIALLVPNTYCISAAKSVAEVDEPSAKNIK